MNAREVFEQMHAWHFTQKAAKAVIGKPWQPRTSPPNTRPEAPTEPRTAAPASAVGSDHAARIGSLRRRLAAATDSGAVTVADIVAAWPAKVPKLTDPDAHTPESLDEVAAMVAALEDEHGLRAAGPTLVEAARGWLAELDRDQYDAVQIAAKTAGVTHLDQGPTVCHIAQLRELIETHKKSETKPGEIKQ